jgi:hypothetical protein
MNNENDNKLKNLNKKPSIDEFYFTTNPDVETEYWINFKLTGKFGEINYQIGKGDNDSYVVGAMNFDDEEELIEKLKDSVEYFSLKKEKGKENIELIEYENGLDLDEKSIEYKIRDKILDSLKYHTDISKLLQETNQTATDVNKSWFRNI